MGGYWCVCKTTLSWNLLMTSLFPMCPGSCTNWLTCKDLRQAQITFITRFDHEQLISMHVFTLKTPYIQKIAVEISAWDVCVGFGQVCTRYLRVKLFQHIWCTIWSNKGRKQGLWNIPELEQALLGMKGLLSYTNTHTHRIWRKPAFGRLIWHRVVVSFH